MKVEPKDLKHSRLYYLKWIWNQYKSHKKMIVILVALTILSTAIAVLFPIVFKFIIDGLVNGLKKYDAGTITLEAAKAERNKMLLMLLALGIGPVFTGLYPYLRARMNVTFEMFFRKKFFTEILAKGHKFFLQFRTGDLVTRLTEDIRTWPPGLSWLCCSGIFRALNSASIIFFCLVSMMLLNWKLALLALIPLPIMLAIFMKLESGFGSSFKNLQTGMSEANDFLEAGFSGIKIIASFNAHLPQKKLFDKLMDKRIEMEMRVDTLWGLFMVFFEFLNYVGEILVLIFGGIMVIRGDITLGVYYAFFSYLGMIIYPLMDIPMLLVTLTQACVAIDRLEDLELADKKWQEQDIDGSIKIESLDSISFKNVSFEHVEHKNASEEVEPEEENKDTKKAFSFKSISFNLMKGEKIAVVGQIGSGKTTLLNLVAGVMKPEHGEILVNDIPLPQINKASFREKIGYIQQEPVIFSETIETNIDFWRGFKSSVIESCTRLSQFEKEVLAFPSGYSEPVGQRGVTLSGGQRQRLSIARALVNSPQLLLMDDITASLDAANERQLWEDLHASFGKITCLIVTHRMATAMMADRIMVLNDGKIDAIGTHDELLKTNDIYRNLSQA